VPGEQRWSRRRKIIPERGEAALCPLFPAPIKNSTKIELTYKG